MNKCGITGGAIMPSFSYGFDGERDDKGTSVFDPVLCEIIYKWFAPEGGKILDPFAGGSVRGIVAHYLGYKYTGIELRKEQIKANKGQATEILKNNMPEWISGDAANINELAKGEYDLLFSCPPYFDLEIYSNDKRDLSNMPYADFLQAYKNIIRDSCNKIKDNRFACFVISNVRDKNGFYRNLVSETIANFSENNFALYNDVILLNVAGSLPIRIHKQFGNYRKIGKVHQNVLIFYKGDTKIIKDNFKQKFDFSKLCSPTPTAKKQ